MTLYSWRVMENDDEDDPLDHGIVVAHGLEQATVIVTAHLDNVIGLWSGTVRFYDHGGMPEAYPAGVIPSLNFYDVLVRTYEPV